MSQLKKTNGLAVRVYEWIKENPGHRHDEIAAAFGTTPKAARDACYRLMAKHHLVREGWCYRIAQRGELVDTIGQVQHAVMAAAALDDCMALWQVWPSVKPKADVEESTLWDMWK